MENKINIARFKEVSRTAEVKGIWQWDYGQILRIQGLNLPTAVEIHFSLDEHGGEAVRRIGVTKDGVTDVVVPDTMLENESAYGDSYYFFAYIYLTDETSGNTEYKIRAKVSTRSKPEGYASGGNDTFAEILKTVNEIAEDKVDIPAHAKVGQVLSVKATDESGKPTEFEAKDMSGGVSDEKIAEAVGAYMEANPIEETDPTVPDWAKQPEKPTYTASEVCALPDTTKIPSKTSDLQNDSGFLTEHQDLSGYALKSEVPKSASEVGADASGTAVAKVSEHNTASNTHNDIRLLVQGLTERLNVLADSDDTTLDQMSEVVAYIKSNKSLIDAITTSKVNVSDIIDNLVTNVSNKPLSAAQGVALKALIDAIAVPTKLSELENDSGYAKTTEIPDKLPNPQKLTFTGAVTAEYDGSGAVTVTIPEGGGTGVTVDNTLSVAGKAADAKATGDAINSLSEEIADIKKNGSGTGSGKTAFDMFMDNIDIDYAFDSETNANYTIIRIYKNKIDGTKQYPFAVVPNTEALTFSALDLMNEYADSNNYLFAINAGFGGFNTGIFDGVLIQNGVVLNNTPAVHHAGSMPLTINSNGDLSYASADADANELVESGVVSALCGFCPIIVDYEPVDPPTVSNVSHFTQNAQRQIIGQFGNGDYAIITCEGRNHDNSDGWTIAEAQTVCQKTGLKFAYNLDGGGSTETVLGKKQLNTIYENETGRKILSFIVFNGKDTFGDVPDNPDIPVEPEVTLSSISATYNGGNVAVGTSVNSLTGITVKAHYSNGSTANVTGYTLSGTIAEGSNTITVSYGGKTTTFAVTGVLDATAYEIIRGKTITFYTTLGYGTISQNSVSRMTGLSTQNTPKLKYENGGTLTGETSDYAPIMLSEDAKTITITCEGCIPAVTLCTTDGEVWTRIAESGWLTADGGTYNLPTDKEYTHYALSFKPNSGSTFDSTVDESKFSIVVE